MVKRIGEEFVNTNGEKAKIIEYFSAINVTVLFEDGTEVKNLRVGNLKTGKFRNKNFKNYYKVGYIGYGDQDKGDFKKPLDVWVRMLQRSYCDKFHIKNPSYRDITVCPEWHNFQVFAKWFKENYVEGWQLDKDIICKECKIYSPETCCFVPREINNLFTLRDRKRGGTLIGITKTVGGLYQVQLNRGKGQDFLGSFKTEEEGFLVYKKGKEKYIKEVADRWKDQIDKRAYKAMYKYKITKND